MGFFVFLGGVVVVVVWFLIEIYNTICILKASSILPVTLVVLGFLAMYFPNTCIKGT